MNDIIKDIKVFWSIGLIFTLAIFGSELAFAQNRTIGGLITIGEINNPGIGGISISIKGTSTTTVSDNDGEYRIFLNCTAL